MMFFSARRNRPGRLSVHKVGTSLSRRLSEQLNRTDVALRLAICLVALAGLTCALLSWQAPFPYRLGDDFPNGMVAQIDFSRVNQAKTDVARLERESREPRVFRENPEGSERLRSLPTDLRRHLFETVDVSRFNELSAEARVAFGWVVPGPSAIDPLTSKFEEEWRSLRDAIGPSETAERKIDDLVGEFSQFIAPIKVAGLVDLTELSRPLQQIRLEDQISIITQESEKISRTASDVVLDELLKVTGTLGSQWKNYPALLPMQPLIERWLRNRVVSSLSFDQVATNAKLAEAHQQTKPVEDDYKRGSLLVAPGAIVKLDEELDVLHAQYDALERKVLPPERIVRFVTAFLMLVVLAGLNGYYLVRNERRLVTNVGRLTVYLIAVTTSIALSRLLSFDPWRAQVVPILCTVMILAIAYNQVLAAMTGFTMTLVLTLAMGRGLGHFVVLMNAITASVVPLYQVSNRMKLVKVGFGAAIAYFLVSLGTDVIETQQLTLLSDDYSFLLNNLRGAGWCFLTGFLVSGSLPFIETLFGVVTDISLLELSDVSHPLLQELIQKAPGTYSHSNGVATISETAADAIGANGLLCRVGAYYHDIGKIMKPHYFVENMTAGQTSRHESLNPAMSALVIIGHVKDGVELAHQHNLPDPLIDFIEQHHGTTLVEYFFHAATKQAEATVDHRFDVEESAFRYPGPKPQSREAAVLMISDAVEGASRTLAEPTPKRLETLVHDIAMKRLLDGQFDESSLTLSELAIIEDSLTKSLIGIHHGRIKYPEQKTA